MDQLSALQTSSQIISGDLSVTEVVDQALERAHADTCNAWTFIDDEGARRRARTLDSRLADPDFHPGPLFGVPCPIKDLNECAGLPMEAGSAVLAGHVSDHDDGVVTRLKAAGTIPIGKTATPEFGLPCYTEPAGRPATVTPFDHTRMSGGSSGGAAAVVGAGEVPIAQGSDGGGSIRIPASCCGVVGLKPSRGRVSWGPDGVDGPGLTTAGVLTRTIRDTAAALDVLSVGWPGDPFPAPRSAGSFLAACEHAPVRLRIGVLTEPVISDAAEIHPAVAAALRRTVTILDGLGHHLAAAPRPFGAEEWAAFRCIWAVGAASIPVPADAEERLLPYTRWLRELGLGYSGVQLSEALAGVQRLTRTVCRLWDRFDVIVSPTLAQPPLRVGRLRDDADPAADFDAQCDFTPWTSVWNLTGRPAISLPLHTATIDGVELPIGIMLGARMGEEAVLMALGCQLEDAG